MNWKRAFLFIISLFIIFSVGCSADYENGGEISITDHEKTEEDNMYTNEELKFYPKHPSGDKTHQIETTAMPFLSRKRLLVQKLFATNLQQMQTVFLLNM